jgi:hypothetical protein
MALALDLDLGAYSKSFPVCSLWQRKLCLPNFSRQRISCFQAADNIHPAIFTRYSNSENTGNSREAIVHETDDQSRVAAFVRHSRPIANAISDPAREGALIEPVGDWRPGAEVVMVKVMRWNVCEDGPTADSQSSQAACRDAGLQERSSLHFCGDLHLDEADLEIAEVRFFTKSVLELEPRSKLHSAEIVHSGCDCS